MKSKLFGFLATATSITVCGYVIGQLMGGLFNIGRVAVQLGLMAI